MSPIVSRRKIILHGRDYLWRVGYSPGHNERDFYMPLPEWVADTLHVKEVRDKTQYLVEKKWRKAIEEYENITATREKVVFYKFLSRVQPYGMPLGDFFSGMSADTGKGEMISYGVAMNLWFMVGYTVTRENGGVDYLDENMKNWSKKGNTHCETMIWTDAREQFFAEFREMMATQISNNPQILPRGPGQGCRAHRPGHDGHEIPRTLGRAKGG